MGATVNKIERTFWRFTRKTKTCWLWTGACGHGGYGHICVSWNYGEYQIRLQEDAHRTSYKLHKGAIPKGAVIMHTCDNPPCVNPEHLVAGTQAQNIADMIRKGRAKLNQPHPGSKNGRARLTNETVVEIRSHTYHHGLYCELARKYGVGNVSIRKAFLRLSWKDIK